MKKRFEDEEIYTAILEQADLFGDMIARFAERLHTFTFDELRPRNAPGHQRRLPGDLFSKVHGGVIDSFRFRAVTGPIKLFARAKEGECLQNLRSRIEKLAMQFSQSVRVFDGDLRRELPAAFAGPNLFAVGTAVHVATAFQFDEVTPVANHYPFLKPMMNCFHSVPFSPFFLILILVLILWASSEGWLMDIGCFFLCLPPSQFDFRAAIRRKAPQ